jgi:hypothetical protein
MIPLVRSARASALTTSLAIALVGVVAGTVRLLPWLLDPDVPWGVAAPFARGLAALAFESALAVGWPVGWALACFRFLERGEARVLQTLGEPPSATVLRLAPQGAALALALATVSAVSGADANAPGRVATELLQAARESCAAARTPSAYVVPFTGMTWLCAPGREPRLAGAVPSLSWAMGNRGVVTAKDARIAGDFRAVELDDARVGFPGNPPVAVHAGFLTMHGMAPWAHASTLVPILRALLLALSAWSTASVAAYGVLRRAVRGRAGAIVLGAVGPLTALGLVRSLERSSAHAGAFLLVPALACIAAAAAAWLLARPVRSLLSLGLLELRRWAHLCAELARRMTRC